MSCLHGGAWAAWLPGSTGPLPFAPGSLAGAAALASLSQPRRGAAAAAIQIVAVQVGAAVGPVWVCVG